MIDDALTLADPYLRISERIRDPETFYLLTDSLLNTIESSPSRDEGMLEAKKVIRRLKSRKLYRLAIDVLVPHDKDYIFNEVHFYSFKYIGSSANLCLDIRSRYYRTQKTLSQSVTSKGHRHS